VAEAILYSITAIIVAVIIAGGINRAAFYVSQAIVLYIEHSTRIYRSKIQGENDAHSSTDKGGRS
jgi:hypothetical protein